MSVMFFVVLVFCELFKGGIVSETCLERVTFLNKVKFTIRLATRLEKSGFLADPRSVLLKSQFIADFQLPVREPPMNYIMQGLGLS